MSARAKLFTHGGSQAVRLPKEFRFDGKEVSVRREGRAVVLEPVGVSREELAAMWARIDALNAEGDLFPEPPEDPPVQPDNRRFFDE